MEAFYTYIAGHDGAFRLVFESDLTNEPAVRAAIDRVTNDCAAMIADVIHDDTGLPDEASRLLAVSLVGMAQVSARFWVTDAAGIDQADAVALVSGLAWRGIRGYPLTDDRLDLARGAPVESSRPRPPAANGLGQVVCEWHAGWTTARRVATR